MKQIQLNKLLLILSRSTNGVQRNRLCAGVELEFRQPITSSLISILLLIIIVVVQ